jgi:hypothetical protein
VNERRLRDALRKAPLDDGGARARSLRVVQAAAAELEPVRPRRRWLPAVAVVATLIAAGIVVAAASSPGDAVARWVRDVLGVGRDDARPALVRVPGGGRLLVSAGAPPAATGSVRGSAAERSSSAWVVSPDGSRRRLGPYTGASWSPNGKFAVVWRGGELLAVEPGGTVRWSLERPGRIAVARWGPADGYRVAYLSGGALRIVNGDGTDDRRFAAARRVAPAWRPDDKYVLAYVDRRERVRVVAVDSGRELWRTGPVPGVRELEWSPDGRRLLIATAATLRLRDRDGRPAGRRELPRGLMVDDVAWAPRGGRVAVVRHGAERSEVVLADLTGKRRQRMLFTGSGRFGAVAWSPNGRRLLVPWPDADQWLFLDSRGGARIMAVGDITRQFAGGPRRGAFPGTVAWCCS